MQDNRQKLIILGTGFGAMRLIRSIDLKKFDVTVVSPRNYFLFTPLLASTTVGTIEFRSIIEPIRSAREKLNYFQATCEDINVENKSIKCRSADDGTEFGLEFDKLVIAVGADNNTYGILGVEENCFFLKDVPDARKIRQKIIKCFERASTPEVSDELKKELLHFVVVGGGPTGVEFAGELNDFILRDLSKLYTELVPYIKISVLEAGSRILNSFDSSLSGYTTRTFAERKINVRTDTLVTEVKKNTLIFEDGSELKFGFALWSTGITATNLVKSLSFAKNSRQQLLTDSYLRVLGEDDLYAIGDCASIDGKEHVATAQLAQQQGKYLAKLLNRGAEGFEMKAFHFVDLGMLAYIGGNRALANMPTMKWRGFVAWIMWRSIYLTKLVSLKNKILVLFDWFKTAFFGRDISRF